MTNDQGPKNSQAATVPPGLKEFPGTPMAGRRSPVLGADQAKPGDGHRPTLQGTSGKIGALHPGHKGTRDEVVNAIQADSSIADHLKGFLLGEIGLIEGKALQVSFHPIRFKDHSVGSWHIKRLF
jgi:hypothetical protein